MDIVLSGIRPTGQLHLGNYFGALRNFVRMQHDAKCYFFIADYHALTTHDDPTRLHENVRTVLAEYLAAGIDPDVATVYVQSDVPQVTELSLLLGMHAYVGELERTASFKDKVRKNPSNVNAGLLTYPVLMAAGLFYLIFCSLKKNRWLLAVMFLTPQIWYLYTYCTSDAMDYAVGVLVLYQVARPDSMLQKLCRRGVKKADWWRVLLLGFLFSNIFMSKQNFYVFAIYAFCMLLVDLFTAPAEEKKNR